MNRDRGVIKWTSMMLPEHVKKLKEMAENQKRKTRPTIDSQVLEEWSRILAEAYNEELVLSITLFNHGYEEQVRGCVKAIDQINRQLTIRNTSNSEKVFIPFHDIVNISISDNANEF